MKRVVEACCPSSLVDRFDRNREHGEITVVILNVEETRPNGNTLMTTASHGSQAD